MYTISGVVQGKSFVDALKGAVSTTLTPENIAKTFMTSAIMSAVMVGSGLVKACFVEDTMVSTPDGLKPIQDIAVGDSVYSFDEATGVVSCVAVTEIMRNTSKDVCTVALDTGESITSTSLHPWYVQGKGWTPAYALASGDILLTDEDEFVTISAVRRRSLSDPVDVYNMTVGDAEDDQYHTYFVGEDSVLVHNACKPSKTDSDRINDLVDGKTKNFKSKQNTFTNDSVHGNSLKTNKKTSLYKLVDESGYTKKIGETTKGARRYTKSFYELNGVKMETLAEGTKAEMKALEHGILVDIKNNFFEYFKWMFNKCTH